ncbi:hypothetical protein VNO77_03620 [Canavalia gladiata]|uniref:Uncharacterized protein n=1 Tax=Canavalia gladiata TaxID=3824 RepID=A0AAN9R708_CANGL
MKSLGVKMKLDDPLEILESFKELSEFANRGSSPLKHPSPLHRRPSSFSLLPALRLGSFLRGRRVKVDLWSKASKLGSVPSKGDRRRFLEEVVDLFDNARLRSLHPSPLPCSSSPDDDRPRHIHARLGCPSVMRIIAPHGRAIALSSRLPQRRDDTPAGTGYV